MLSFVSFEPIDSDFQAQLSLESALQYDGDAPVLANRAADIYATHIAKMRHVCAHLSALRRERQRIPALLMWELGDVIFALRDELTSVGLEVDDVYAHLTRDLEVRRKWLEKVIIFRRYVREKGGNSYRSILGKI